MVFTFARKFTLAERSQLSSILFLKCPRCRKGPLLESHPYNLKKFNAVRERCPNCGQKYRIEPSFFYGSMYVSYGVGVAIAVAVYVLSLIFGLEWGPLGIFIAIVAAIVITFPYIGAVSKSIWAHFFIHYDPNHPDKSSEKN